MPSLRNRILTSVLARRFKPNLERVAFAPAAIAATRARMDRFGTRVGPARGLRREGTTLDGVPVEWTRVGEPRGVVYYCHGGGYIVGSPVAYRRFANRLARATGHDVAMIDYRLAPEHPFPAATDDALAGYRALLTAGHDAGSIVLAGDSAGGGLALVTLLRIVEAGLAIPAAAVLLSPWTDLAATGASVRENASSDPMLPAGRIAEAAATYAGTAALDHPWVSPLYGDFSRLPPLLVIAGSTEILRDDAIRVVERARAAGREADLQIWREAPHVFPVFADILPEGRRAIAHIADFVKRARR